MSYDLRGSMDEFASHHSALYSGSYEEGEQKVFNQDWIVNYFISNGAPPEKLNLGLAMYGKSFVWNSDARMIGGPAKFGDFVSYKQVCGYLNSKWKRVWVEDQQVPFIFQGNVMVGYDDPDSIGIKLNYTLQRGLGGVLIWSVDQDDNTGYGCNQGKFPLMTKIYEVLKDSTIICTTTPKPTTPSPESAANRTKMITPAWKKTSKFMPKDYRGTRFGLGNSSDSLFKCLQNAQLFLALVISFKFLF